MLNRIRRAGFAATAFTLYAAPVSMGAHASELNLSLNDDAARLTYAWDVADNGLKLDGGWLHHQDRGDVINLGLHLEGAASSGTSPVIGGTTTPTGSSRRVSATTCCARPMCSWVCATPTSTSMARVI